MKKRVAVVGSREYGDMELVRKFVRNLARTQPEAVVVSGGARGVDRTAEGEARACGLKVVSIKADWDTYGKRAGFLRNGTIVEQSDVVVAFWDGESRGTIDTATKAAGAGKGPVVFGPAGRMRGGLKGMKLHLLDAQRVQSCTKCPLAKTRTNTVFGEGDPDARLVFVGEAPGKDEDEQGRPFVGCAGKLLDKMIEAMGLKREDVFICNTLKCLYYNAFVKTEEGNKRIDWIVKHRWSGKVLSVNNGMLTWNRIVGWHRSPLGNRKIFKVRFVNGKRTGTGFAGVNATEDHPFLTRRGWVELSKLRSDDLVATGTPSPGPRAFQIMTGSLLGDASVTAQYRFQESHSAKQADYARLKAGALSAFGYKVSSYKVRAEKDGRFHDAIAYALNNSLYIHNLRQQWYPAGKKLFPLEAVSRIDRLGLAVWYMDDGSWRPKPKSGNELRVEIALGNVGQDEAEKLPPILQKFGLKTYVRFRGTWRLFFRYGYGRKFLQLVAPFIPPSMRYKLPDEMQSIPFDANSYKPEATDTYWSRVIVDSFRPNSHQKSVYCIDVEGTANFVTPGGVVHNCRPPDNRTPEKSEIRACSPYLGEQLSIIGPDVVVALGAPAAQTILSTDERIGKLRGRFHDFRISGTEIMIPLMPTYHPAYLLRSPGEKTKVAEDLKMVMEKLELCGPLSQG